MILKLRFNIYNYHIKELIIEIMNNIKTNFLSLYIKLMKNLLLYEKLCHSY